MSEIKKKPRRRLPEEFIRENCGNENKNNDRKIRTKLPDGFGMVARSGFLTVIYKHFFI